VARRCEWVARPAGCREPTGDHWLFAGSRLGGGRVSGGRFGPCRRRGSEPLMDRMVPLAPPGVATRPMGKTCGRSVPSPRSLLRIMWEPWFLQAAPTAFVCRLPSGARDKH
jgi:hypothetical protein